MTYEEAIKHFRSLQKRYTTEHNGKMCENVALALEAMEKQVPKKPKKADWMLERWGYEHECPACFSGVGENEKLHYIQEPYCSQCGQALLWEDTE